MHGEIYTGTKFRVMQNIHSIHPTSRPDLFTKIEIDLNEETNDKQMVILKEKYRREKNGFKVKELRKYRYESKFCKADGQNRNAEKKLKCRNDPLASLTMRKIC